MKRLPNVFRIFEVRANGSHLRRVADTTVYGVIPAFSPNGKRIAFQQAGEIC